MPSIISEKVTRHLEMTGDPAEPELIAEAQCPVDLRGESLPRFALVGSGSGHAQVMQVVAIGRKHAVAAGHCRKHCQVGVIPLRGRAYGLVDAPDPCDVDPVETASMPPTLTR